MTSSLTTALEEMRRENDALKTDITQLRTDNDAMKNENEQLKAKIDKHRDEIGELKAENLIIKDESKQLTTLLDKMAVSNENQTQQIQLKVSQWSVITCTCMIVFWFHDTLYM